MIFVITYKSLEFFRLNFYNLTFWLVFDHLLSLLILFSYCYLKCALNVFNIKLSEDPINDEHIGDGRNYNGAGSQAN